MGYYNVGHQSRINRIFREMNCVTYSGNCMRYVFFHLASGNQKHANQKRLNTTEKHKLSHRHLNWNRI